MRTVRTSLLLLLGVGLLSLTAIRMMRVGRAGTSGISRVVEPVVATERVVGSSRAPVSTAPPAPNPSPTDKAEWVTRLEEKDCRRFYTLNATNQVPELRLLDHLFGQYNLTETERFMAIRRAYEGASDVVRFSDLRDSAIESINGEYRNFLVGQPDPELAKRAMEERMTAIQSARESFESTVASKRSATISDLRNLIPEFDEHASNLVFSIRPRILAAPEDLGVSEP